VEIHPQTNKYVAETVFSNLRAGSNFNDGEDQQLIGTNGVGSTLTNVLSTSFKVESCDGKKVFRQEFSDGMRERSKPSIKDHAKNGTKITFKPDYEFFKLPGLTEGNRLKMIKKVVDAAACNTNIKFYINSERVMVKQFDDYVALYADEFVTDETEDWKVAISTSDGFEQISFVNSVETFQGGTHVDYVMNQITQRLREHIKKKHKIDVKPSDIKGHMRVYISANVNRPKFSSQTKENMISPVSEYKTSWEAPDKMITKIVKSSIIQNILDWAEAKQRQEELRELRRLNKETDKTDPRRVEKFSDALEKKDRTKCILVLSEGDSASKSIQAARGKNPYIGSFPMKGKILNVREREMKRVLENEEIKKILTIIGLKLGEPVETIPANDGEWVELEINGKKLIVNEHDTVHIDNMKIKVKDYL
jgi:DNA topoisomerase-2